MSEINNKRVAEFLFEIADLLDLKGVQFKPRAYRRAAQNISTLSKNIETYYEEDTLDEIEGVGESIAKKVKEIIETGDLQYLNELRDEFPEGLQEMMNIQGIGPKTLMKLYKQLEVKNINDLEAAAENHEIREVEGFGKKSEQNILENIKMYRKFQERFLLGYILPIATGIKEKLRDLDEVQRIKIAGSIRRRKETIGDVDILIISSNPENVMDFFTELPEVEKIVSKGHTKSTIITADNLQVDLRVVEEPSFGSALQYFTGSKEHNIKLRTIALDKNYKLSEYGLIDKDSNESIAGENEKEIYDALGLDYIVPELRENRGEIEAAKDGNLPNLINIDDIKGDLHVHTTWSEGSHSIKEMAETAKGMGYEYLAICDHAKTLQIAQGITDKEILKQIEQIRDLNERMNDFTILSGIEANIDSDGNLDVNDDVLDQLDIVVASIHSGFKSSETEMTERIINALHNEYVNILGHPTGRMLNKREPYEVNLTKLFEAAADQSVFLEVNSFPERLDLSDVSCFKAKDYDVRLAINTDAHSKEHLRYMKLGVYNARRGWIESKKVVNTLSLDDLKQLL